MFLGKATGGGNAAVSGFYVDDDWGTRGPSEMDKDAVAKMGMSTADVTAARPEQNPRPALCGAHSLMPQVQPRVTPTLR